MNHHYQQHAQKVAHTSSGQNFWLGQLLMTHANATLAIGEHDIDVSSKASHRLSSGLVRK